MIDVKGTKSDQAALTGMKRFRETPEGAPRGPMIVGAVVAALVAFVQSLSAKAEAAPAADPGHADDDRRQAPIDAGAGTADTPAEAPATADTDASDPSPAIPTAMVSSGNIVSLFAESFSRSMLTGDQLQFVDPPVPVMPGHRAADPSAPAHPASPALHRLRPKPMAIADPDDDSRNGAPGGRRGPNPLPDVLTTAAFFIALEDLLPAVAAASSPLPALRNLKPSSGTLEPTAGGYIFYPDPATPRHVTLTYTIDDGTRAVPAQVAFDVVANPIQGTDAADRLAGTDAADLITAGAGDDAVAAAGGDDVVHGGTGDDVIRAGAGDDLVFGGAGRDAIYGEAGDDRLWGDAGDDALFGGAGADRLEGGAGDDLLDGGAGSDIVRGGDGDDRLWGSRDAANDLLDGGAGTDTLDLSTATQRITVHLGQEIAAGAEIGTDRLASIENVIGGAGNDRLTGDGGDNVLRGGGGDDQISGGAGADVIRGGDASDQLSGDAGNDMIDGGTGDDVIKGGDGNDRLLGGTGDDVIDGDAGNDLIDGGAGDDVIDGGDGSDQLLGGDGEDQINGDAGNDIIDGGAGDDLIDGGTGDDMIQGGDGDDVIQGGDGNDSIDGGTGDDIIFGGAGVDLLCDSAGVDRIDGGAGDDIVVVFQDGQADVFVGGAGLDTISFERITDSVVIDVDAGTASCGVYGQDNMAGFEIVIGGQNDDTFLIDIDGDTDSLTLTGGKGSDTYALSFAATDDGFTVRAFQITDFGPGDVVASGRDRYRSDRRIDDDSKDYTSATPSTTLRTADVRHETRHDTEYTIIEISDPDGQDVFEVTMNGHLDIWIDFT